MKLPARGNRGPRRIFQPARPRLSYPVGSSQLEPVSLSGFLAQVLDLLRPPSSRREYKHFERQSWAHGKSDLTRLPREYIRRGGYPGFPYGRDAAADNLFIYIDRNGMGDLCLFVAAPGDDRQYPPAMEHRNCGGRPVHRVRRCFGCGGNLCISCANASETGCD
jgi:hypothetical protein